MPRGESRLQRTHKRICSPIPEQKSQSKEPSEAEKVDLAIPEKAESKPEPGPRGLLRKELNKAGQARLLLGSKTLTLSTHTSLIPMLAPQSASLRVHQKAVGHGCC